MPPKHSRCQSIERICFVQTFQSRYHEQQDIGVNYYCSVFSLIQLVDNLDGSWLLALKVADIFHSAVSLDGALLISVFLFFVLFSDELVIYGLLIQLLMKQHIA